mgnify:CR=1 FL=1
MTAINDYMFAPNAVVAAKRTNNCKVVQNIGKQLQCVKHVTGNYDYYPLAAWINVIMEFTKTTPKERRDYEIVTMTIQKGGKELKSFREYVGKKNKEG